MRRFVVFGMVVACALWSTTALGQYDDDNEGYNASKDGVDLNGQGDFYNPDPPNSVSGKVYTYKDNVLEIRDYPSGGGDHFVGSTGPGGAKFARSQKDMEYGTGEGVWTVAVDIAAVFVGNRPSAQNVGSLSTQTFPGDATFIALARWVNTAQPDNWNADVVWFNSAGTQLLEVIPDAGFQNLKTKNWYRWTWTFDLDSNKITKVEIKDLHTGEGATYEPPDRYLFGGQNGAPTPGGFRYFAGARDIAGNTLAFDNLDISTEGGGENCDGNNPARVKAKCKSGGKKVIAKLKKAKANTDVTFEIDGGDKIDKTTNNRGKAKGKFKRQAPGNHTVTVCDLKAKCSP